MAFLNEKNETTEKIIHLMITDKCNRKCPDCCNNQYDLETIEKVTVEELSKAEKIFFTGGEPFAYGEPCSFAMLLKDKYPNIKEIYVYSNALELAQYLNKNNVIRGIDGITVSIKNKADKDAFENIINKSKDILNLKSNRLYVFPGFEDTECSSKFIKTLRTWQKDFVPATDSIFRRL